MKAKISHKIPGGGLWYKTFFSLLLFGLTAAVLPGATFTVISTNDDGPGSLREAIDLANANAGRDSIKFDIPGPGPHVISPLSPLPLFWEGADIEGFSQPGAVDAPAPTIMVELNGNLVIEENYGLGFPVGDCSVRGLAVNGFPVIGLLFNGPNMVVERNFVGLSADGSLIKPNGFWGVYGFECDNPLVAENVASGNGTGGILVRDSNGVTIRDNLIGTDPTGIYSMGNNVSQYFYALVSWFNKDGKISGNVVSGNNGHGSLVQDCEGVVFRDNLIGVAADGSTPLGNPSLALYMLNLVDCEFSNNEMAYVTDYFGVVGYNVRGSRFNNNHAHDIARGAVVLDEWHNGEVSGNTIGIDQSGESSSTFGDALSLRNSSSVTIDQNHLSTALGNGLSLYRSQDIVVSGNTIGTKADGTGVAGKAWRGINCFSRIRNVLIQGNLIGGVGSALAVGFDCEAVEVDGNHIGTDVDRLYNLGVDYGILLDSTGYPVHVHDNVISNTEDYSLHLIAADGSLIENNELVENLAVLTDPWQIEIDSHAVVLVSSTTGAVIRGNRIVDSAGDGILLSGSTQNLIEDNVISGHDHGIRIREDKFEIYENGELTYEYFNPVFGNAILGNSIYGSRKYGIELVKRLTVAEIPNDPIETLLDVGPHQYDILDTDEGANNLLNQPIMRNGIIKNGMLMAKGQLKGLPDSTQLVQIFASSEQHASGRGEGERFLGEGYVTTNEEGNVHFSIELEGSVLPGEWITATATDMDGNTSEFSNAIAAISAGQASNKE